MRTTSRRRRLKGWWTFERQLAAVIVGLTVIGIGVTLFHWLYYGD